MRQRFHSKNDFDAVAAKKSLTNCTYLEDSGCMIDGVTFWGSPWQPEFFGWAFNLPRGDECHKMWKKVPTGIKVLLTHGPPIGHGDLCMDGARAGCVNLLQEIQNRIKP